MTHDELAALGVIPTEERFTPLAPAEPYTGRICVIDTEGSALTDRYTATAQWDDVSGEVLQKRFTTAAQFGAFLSEQAQTASPVLFFAHNLEWDLQVMFAWLRDPRSGVKYVRHSARRNGSALMATFDYDERRKRQRLIQIRDSFAIWPMSLAKLGKVVGIPKYRTPRALIPNMVNWSTGEIIEAPENDDSEAPNCEAHDLAECLDCYDLRDVAVLYAAMRLYLTECAADNVKPSLTRSAHAMRDYRTNYLPVPLVQYTEKQNLRAQAARHGGRSQMLKHGLTVCEPAEVIVTADVVSEYPSVMRAGNFPDARYHHVMHHPAAERVREYVGWAWAEVDIPPMLLGPLLYHDTATGRISYPTDVTLQSAWTTDELAYALDVGCAVRVTRLEGCHRDLTLDPFSRYVTEKFAARAAAKRDGNPLAEAIKLSLNGLSGKFGMNWVEPMLEFRAVRDDDDQDLHARVFNDPCVRADREPARYPDYVMTPWSSLIMARGRIMLHKMGMRLAAELGAELLMCDTDSWCFKVDRGRLACVWTDLFGDKLGQWQVEPGDGYAFRGAAPKEYAVYADAAGLFAGEPVKARAKGIGAVGGGAGEKNRAVDHYLRTGNVHFQRPAKTRGVLSGAPLATFVNVAKTRHAATPHPTPVIATSADFTANVATAVRAAERGTLWRLRAARAAAQTTRRAMTG